MAFNHVYKLGKVEIDMAATSTGTLKIHSDLPGNAIAERYTVNTPVCSRRTVAHRLPYALIGHLFNFVFASTGITRLYGIRVWARELPYGVWQWYSLPVVPTADGWSTSKLLIPPTPDFFSEYKLPIKRTPPVANWVELAVDE